MVSRPYKAQAYQAQIQAYQVRPVGFELFKETFRYGFKGEKFEGLTGWEAQLGEGIGYYVRGIFDKIIGESFTQNQKRQANAVIDAFLGDRAIPNQVVYENGIDVSKFTVAQLKDRCNGICKKYPGSTPTLGASSNCYCKGGSGTSTTTGGPSQAAINRCRGLCTAYTGGVKLVKPDGSCYCSGVKTGTSTGPVSAGQRCIQLQPSCKGSSNPCWCRCQKTCGSTYTPQMKSDYSCSCIKKSGTGGTATTPGQRCIQLKPECKGSSNPCWCRCQKTCSSGYTPHMRSDYSCYCVRKQAALTPGQRCIQLVPSCKGQSNPCWCRCKKTCRSGYNPHMRSDYSCYCVKSISSSSGGGGGSSGGGKGCSCAHYPRCEPYSSSTCKSCCLSNCRSKCNSQYKSRSGTIDPHTGNGGHCYCNYKP